jgi:hypothetical protein
MAHRIGVDHLRAGDDRSRGVVVGEVAREDGTNIGGAHVSKSIR